MNNTCRFEVVLQIDGLNNLPLGVGEISVKWFIRDSRRANARGKTKAVPIVDHAVVWDYSAVCVVKLYPNSKDRTLKQSYIEFHVTWDNHSSGSSISLGHLELDLSPHVVKEGDESKPLRTDHHTYLLQKSKINCGLKVALKLTQISGPQDYIVPEFAPPKVFSEITGVIDTEKSANGIDDGNLDKLAEVLNSSASFEFNWATQAGYLNPRSAIDDIFLGGDGFDHSTTVSDEPEKSITGAHILKETLEREHFSSWTIGSAGDDI